ncbi:hypothetical protein L227DRAFT_85772 [Lentinus tigrinus ALCF2SS1-6]|uniref:Uncharacterized protein n=1 Tax=Lentinus tigrinus ALCF2SS1-6 TaxID=1328759 RepID=A0A5C2SCJ8_9APHY|nr:hypothetical protein L227DRAFT_85772 [Lentinus tigrinus ALCF2SS1-6]
MKSWSFPVHPGTELNRTNADGPKPSGRFAPIVCRMSIEPERIPGVPWPNRLTSIAHKYDAGASTSSSDRYTRSPRPRRPTSALQASQSSLSPHTRHRQTWTRSPSHLLSPPRPRSTTSSSSSLTTRASAPAARTAAASSHSLP